MMIKGKIILGVAAVVAVVLGAIFFSQVFTITYSVASSEDQTEQTSTKDQQVRTEESDTVSATHISTPEPLKAIYMTSWVAGTPSLRENILQLVDDTEANAIVIDIKDDTGRISYEVLDKELHEVGSWENRIPDVRDLIKRLHDSGIYVIGRISVFQDPYYTSIHPELAIKRASDGSVWKDYKGLSFVDASAKPYWDYVIAIAHDAYNAGFDEINFDYIRFPSDGNMEDIFYPHTGKMQRADAIESFFAYLYDKLKNSGIVLSADLFGYTTTNIDDLGIGQLLERTLPYFDYVMPMVYPSHYNSGFIGYENPAAYPYEVVKYSMDSAVRRAEKMQLASGSTSTSTEVVRLKTLANKGHGNISPNQIRPWLQDFDLGATYTADMVRKQIQATYDAGLTSWSLWDAGNTYTPGALHTE